MRRTLHEVKHCRVRHIAVTSKVPSVDGEVLDDEVARLGAQGARVVGKHGLLLVSAGPLGLRERAIKRLFDVAFAGTAILVLSPLLITVALAIKLQDGGSVFFNQRRMGRGNRFFNMYKFRSMRVGADAELARLGAGFQLTNLIRDVHEDWATMGRIYLPGLKEDDLERRAATHRLREHVAIQVARARELFRDADALARALPDGGARSAVGVDPRLFRAFDVEAVPTFVVTATDFDLCDGFDCRTAVPPHDRMSGNVTLEFALDRFATGGGPAARVAAAYRARLTREDQR